MEYNIVENESFDYVNLSYHLNVDKEKSNKNNLTINDELIAEASRCYNSELFNKALEIYDQLISIDKENNVLYSNRSAIFLKLGRTSEAIEQANLAIELKSDWAKVFKLLS